MQINTKNNLQFKSKIRPINYLKYREIIDKMGKNVEVKPPWTLAESIKNKNAFSTNIIDCTVCGLTNGQDVLMLHICPTVEKNKNFSKIKDFILKNFDVTSYDTRGFLVGSQKNNMYSQFSDTLFQNFVNFMEKFEIPFSQFRGTKKVPVHVAYSSTRDEWLLSNPIVNPYRYDLESLKMSFDDIKIDKGDELILY